MHQSRLVHQRLLMVFHWSLSDSKSPQVSWTLLCILVDLNNDVVWIVSTRPLISKSFSCGTNRLITLPIVLVIIGITVNFMSRSLFFFFNSLTRSRYLSHLSLSFSFTLGRPERQSLQCSIYQKDPFVSQKEIICILSERSICISKSQRILWVSFSRTGSGMCMYDMFGKSNLNFLHNTQRITLPIQLCLVFYSLCSNLLHSLCD